MQRLRPGRYATISGVAIGRDGELGHPAGLRRAHNVFYEPGDSNRHGFVEAHHGTSTPCSMPSESANEARQRELALDQPNIRLLFAHCDHSVGRMTADCSSRCSARCDLVRYDQRQVFALDAPGCSPPDKADGISFGHDGDSFICEAVTPLVRGAGIERVV